MYATDTHRAPAADRTIKLTLDLYLQRLHALVQKIPESLFSAALAEDMFCLQMNAKIAANFALRGYCPLLGIQPRHRVIDGDDKAAVLQQIQAIREYLASLPEVHSLADCPPVRDIAGDAELLLPAAEFLDHYIIPNLLFHTSMVYAIARANGAEISKGDYDGLHQYQPGFSFVQSKSQTGIEAS